MSSKVRAWLLDWPAQPLALAQCEVIEVIETPEVHRVPIGPSWRRALVYWREQLLPLALDDATSLAGLVIVVVAWQSAPRTPLQFAALPVRGMPRQIDVPAEADCDPPAECVFSVEQMRACFRYEGRAIIAPELMAFFAPAARAA